ncbi:MAG: ROK family protein [Novosphingobium sp.]|nr:ROK family protein [Novosphingobium sp.]MCC6926638.1 ROK family protein [Novosphingobium sp.]
MSADARNLFGAVEAGGTKFVLAIGNGHDEIVAQTQIPTTTPDETLQRAIEWFQGQGGIAALGIASFGPVDLDPASPTWGSITDTPKPGWSQARVAARLGAALGCPVGLDTDVNGAAIGEYQHGAAKGCDVAIYVTVGTGIGGGAIIGGATIKGSRHPEMGHVMLRRHPQDLGFAGACPVHGDCLEGLASGPAIKARWGATLSDLAPDHLAHEIIADYLAQLCQTLIALYSPQRIILGGGVLQTAGLLDKVRARAAAYAGSYFGVLADEIIVAPGLGTRSGIVGAFELAKKAVNVEI